MKNTKSSLEKILSPIQKFLKMEASGGIILIISTIVALVWANSIFSESYFNLWSKYVTLDIAGFKLKNSIHHWINDGLMVIFFFVVGLEIKRELIALDAIKNGRSKI